MRILRLALTIAMLSTAVASHQMWNQEIPLLRFLDFDFLVSVLTHFVIWVVDQSVQESDF